MKKFLSLALALVMTLSLVTISAGATFTDDSEIAYSEAVDVLTALEVVGGYANGSFDPDGTLTRGAAAKIICNLLLGPTVAAALGTNTDPFPDVAADHTFAGYIAYCANEGIISGYTDGTFRPSGTITGYAFMKMLLGALGYDSSIEGYTDTNWAVNVSGDAKLAGLDDGNEDYDGSKAITREEACLYALNTLTADVVEYDNQSNITIGDIVISNSSSAKKIDASGSYKDNIYVDDYMQFAEVNFTSLKIDKNNDTDAFGRPAITWTYKSDDIGTYVDPSDLIASYEGKVTHATMYSLLGTDSSDGVTIFEDGEETVTDAALKNATTSVTCFTKNSTSAVGNTGNSSYTEVYGVEDSNGDMDYTIAVINSYLMVATDDYDADDEVLEVEIIDPESTYLSVVGASVEDEISNDDFYVADFEEDDYILVTLAYNSSDDEYQVQSAVAAETVTGEVTSYVSDSYVYIDGTKYSYNTVIDDADADNGSTVTFSAGDEATLVLDQYGNVLYVDEAIVGSDNYVYIKAFKTSDDYGSNYTVTASAYFADGTYASIDVYEVYGEDNFGAGDTSDYDYMSFAGTTVVNGTASSKTTDGITDAEGAYVQSGNWFTYTTNSDGSYDLMDLNSSETQATTSSTTITNSNVTFDGDVLKGNSSTVFVVLDDDGDVYSYTGITNVPNVTSADTIDAVEKSNYSKYVFIDASSGTVTGTGTAASDFMFVLDYNGAVVSSGTTVYEYDVLIDGEEEVILSTFSDGTGIENVMYFDVEVDSDGNIDGGTVFNGTNYNGFDALKSLYYHALNDATVSASSDVISFTNADSSTASYLVGDADIYVIANDGTGILTNAVAEYEWNTYSSAARLEKALEAYYLDAALYVVADDEGSYNANAIYVFVNGTVEIPDDLTITVDGNEDSTTYTSADTIASLGETEGYVYVTKANGTKVGYYAYNNSTVNLVDGYKYYTGYYAITAPVAANGMTYTVTDYALGADTDITLTVAYDGTTDISSADTVTISGTTISGTVTVENGVASSTDVTFDMSGDDVVLTAELS